MWPTPHEFYSAAFSEGEELLAETISDGSAADKFRSLVSAQGGDLAAFAREIAIIEEKVQRVEVKAPLSGHLVGIDALSIGQFCHRRGAGRTRKDEAVNPWVGIVLRKKTGDTVLADEVLAEAYVPLDDDPNLAQTEVLSAVSIGDKPAPKRLISTVICA